MSGDEYYKSFKGASSYKLKNCDKANYKIDPIKAVNGYVFIGSRFYRNTNKLLKTTLARRWYCASSTLENYRVNRETVICYS